MDINDINDIVLDNETAEIVERPVSSLSSGTCQSTASRMSSIAEAKVNKKWAQIFISLIIFFIAENVLESILSRTL